MKDFIEGHHRNPSKYYLEEKLKVHFLSFKFQDSRMLDDVWAPLDVQEELHNLKAKIDMARATIGQDGSIVTFHLSRCPKPCGYR